MNRTAVIFSLAGALALSAYIVGKKAIAPPVPLPVDPPVVVVEPVKPPEPVQVPVQVPVGPGSLTMVGHLSDPVVALGEPRTEYLKIDITGVGTTDQRRAPVNLAVVLDRSGSMAGEKLENARRAAHVLVDQLNEQDRLAFISFGSNVTPVFNSTVCTPEAKADMHRKIDKIYDMKRMAQVIVSTRTTDASRSATACSSSSRDDTERAPRW